MSTTPIWSLSAKRHELGGATKGTIYLSKFGIGALTAFVLWIIGLRGETIIACCATAFVTEKVCWYAFSKTWPTSWDDGLDWICDGMLHFGFYAIWSAIHYQCRTPLLMLALFLVSYPWSCE